MLHISFNQDDTCFACGTIEGFTIYNCEPLKERFHRKIDGGIAIIEMLFRSNITALVGWGSNPEYPSDTVVLWDDYQNKRIAELKFRSVVKAVKLRRENIIVVLVDTVYVYGFTDLKQIAQLDTYYNPRGLCVFSPGEKMVLAVPAVDPGHVQVVLTNLNINQTIKAHDSALGCMGLTRNGEILATASEKGTLIRLWNTETGEKIRELRRGIDIATIWSLSFNSASTELVASSNKGTAHVYTLEDANKNRKSSFQLVGDYVSYFGSEWSMSSFAIPGNCICTFAELGAVIAVSKSGVYYKFKRNDGGEFSLASQSLLGKSSQ